MKLNRVEMSTRVDENPSMKIQFHARSRSVFRTDRHRFCFRWIFFEKKDAFGFARSLATASDSDDGRARGTDDDGLETRTIDVDVRRVRGRG